MNAPMSIHQGRLKHRKMRWWYESLADYMIANPQSTQNEIAAYFGRQACTISTIVNTDAFKAYFRARRSKHAEQLDDEVRRKLFTVANNSLEHMITVLEKKRDTVPLELLQRTADSALKNLGYGVPPPAASAVPQSTTVNVAVSLDDLEAARRALRRSQESPLVDVSPLPDGSALLGAARPDEPVATEGRGAGTVAPSASVDELA